MSIMVRSLELEHPSWGAAGGCKEVFTSKGHKCCHCHGEGWIWKDNGIDEREKMDCPWCNGCGLMDAVVTVEWKAGERIAVAQQHAERKEVSER